MNDEKKKISPILVIVGLAIFAIFVLIFIKKGKNGQGLKIEEPVESVIPLPNEVKIVSVEGGSFYYKPNEIRVKKGDKVKIVFSSKGGTHNFVIDEFNVSTEEISDGKTTEIVFTPTQSGTFEFYCSIANHREMGMKGKIVVE